MDRVRTGIEGLDQLLFGGLLPGDAMLVGGAPGTGKTSLGMQYLYNGITKYQEPGLFITFEEFPQRIYRDAANYGWDFRALQDAGHLKVLFTSPEVLQHDIVRDEGLVTQMIRETKAQRVVVDSITHLQRGDDDRQFRESLYGLVNALKRESLTALLLREIQEQEELGAGPEDFVADGIILLTRSYIGNHHMRFLEVLKSRGTPHIAIPSLFFLGNGGIRVLPPFQEPFYRFEEAVSTGIPQLDDLLGGGIPYGTFYLIEVDSDLHQDVFDADFAREALDTEDIYVRIAGPSDEMSRWRSLLRTAGLEKQLDQAARSGRCVYLWPSGPKQDGETISPEALATKLTRICDGAGEMAVRIQIDFARLCGLLPHEQGCATVAELMAACRGQRTVVVGVVSPQAVPADGLQKLRAAADGIVRVWNEGSYSFLQVVKTVNSARTPVYALNYLPKPPYIEILTH